MARIHDVIQDLFGSDTTEEMILDAFRCDHAGFTSHPRAVAQNHGIFVRGDFNTSTHDCSYAGFFERFLGRDGPYLMAHHQNILVVERFRKQGLAKHHLAKLLEFYKRVKIEYVRLEALGYGALVWPQLGFELREPDDMKLLKEQFCRVVGELGYEVEPPDRAPALALAPEISGIEVGLEALDRTYRALGERAIPMILDLRDRQTRAFLVARGMLESGEGKF